jgi:S-adenosylmethionine:tRNA ribosyltransferase-isomerase
MNNLERYDYLLPKHLIAQSAFHPRDHCKLLVLNSDGKIEHRRFYELVDYLQPGDVLVVNETKVKPAKLIGTKETGGKVEVILTRERKPLVFECRIKGSNIKVGSILRFSPTPAEVLARDKDFFIIVFAHQPSPQELQLPTPPYVKLPIPEQDYQTIFARYPGSLAAPTAGLHFTPGLLKKIRQKRVNITKIRLDISYETFLPVRDLATHATGKEYFKLDKENAKRINQAKRIIAVGTTVVKCLESCRWSKGKDGEKREVIPAQGYSQLFIRPGYQFKAPIKALITNFHLPKSSLLLLTCAFGGRERILRAYEEAIKNNYRFYSLGDGMMIWK